jgi:hypothetical protein
LENRLSEVSSNERAHGQNQDGYVLLQCLVVVLIPCRAAWLEEFRREIMAFPAASMKLLDHSFHLIVLAFAGMLEDDLSVPVDDVLRWPVLIVVGVPSRIGVVLRDRIIDAMALDRGLDIAGHLLERELRGCAKRKCRSL